jgi:hypothetical protein
MMGKGPQKQPIGATEPEARTDQGSRLYQLGLCYVIGFARRLHFAWLRARRIDYWWESQRERDH